jgi:hypothetical protein
MPDHFSLPGIEKQVATGPIDPLSDLAGNQEVWMI